MCGKIADGFDDIEEACVRLTAYGVQPRYPMEIELSESDMRQAITDADHIISSIAQRIDESSDGIQGQGLEALAMSNPAIRKALTIEEMFKADTRERRLYEMREKAFLDEISNVAGAKAEGKAETICQYLEARFGTESQSLQETVRTIADLDALNRISNRIFTANKLEEAKALIQGNLIPQ